MGERATHAVHVVAAAAEPAAPAAMIAAWLLAELGGLGVVVSVSGGDVVLSASADEAAAAHERVARLLAEDRFAGWRLAGRP